jgi:di/tricarboxylate transporter
MAFLAILGPMNYEDKDLVRIPWWITLVSMLVVFVQYAPPGGY